MIIIKNRFTDEVAFTYDFDDLQHAYFFNAVFKHCDLKKLDLSYSNLKCTDFREADLSFANLENVDLTFADLKGANLKNANLRGANLCYADLYDANLQGADLRDIKVNYGTTGYHLACPEVGEFIGYKKCRDNIIVTLKIPEDAKRSSATTLKCRASKVEVLSLNYGDIAYSRHDKYFTYQIGQIIEVNDFDDDRWNECSRGIHFFMNESAALSYEV